MPKLKDSAQESYEYKDGYLREFDMAMYLMQPHERAGYLQSAYLRAKEGKFSAEFLMEMAKLLEKWSSEKRNFVDHAGRLMRLAEEVNSYVREVDEKRDSDIRNIKGNSHSLVHGVLSDSPGPMIEEEDAS